MAFEYVEGTAGACTSELFPFNYFDANGTAVSGVEGQNGLCTFPSADCGPDVPVYTCCQAKPELKATGGSYMFIAFAIIFLPLLYLKYFSKVRAVSIAFASALFPFRRPQRVLYLPLLFRLLFPSQTQEERDAMAEKKLEQIPSWVKAIPSKFIQKLFQFGLFAYITAQILGKIHGRFAFVPLPSMLRIFGSFMCVFLYWSSICVSPHLHAELDPGADDRDAT